MQKIDSQKKHFHIPFIIDIFLPLTPILFFLIFFFHLLDFLPHETLDWLNVFLDSKSISFYFSPLFLYLFLTFIFLILGVIIFSETVLVCSQKRIICNLKLIFISSLNSISIFVLIYFIGILISFSIVLASIEFPLILSFVDLNLLDFILKIIKYLHIVLALLVLVYVQFILPIYLRVKKIKLSFKIFLRRIRRSFYYLINIFLYILFIYSSAELVSLLLSANLKYFLNSNELFLYYKDQVATMKTVSDVFVSFGFLTFIIIIGLLIFSPAYNIVYILGKKLIRRSISNK